MPEQIAVKEPTETVETDKKGRPCKYETHVEPYLDKIFEWLKEGYTDYSIAEQLGISQLTWIRYKDKYDNLLTLYTRARAERNCLVMNKQFESAVGYEHKDLFIAQYQGEIVQKEIIKHYPPNVQAADLFLRNNNPDYIAPRAAGGVTLVQNNYQLPQLEADLQLIQSRRKELETLLAVDVEVIEE